MKDYEKEALKAVGFICTFALVGILILALIFTPWIFSFLFWTPEPTVNVSYEISVDNNTLMVKVGNLSDIENVTKVNSTNLGTTVRYQIYSFGEADNPHWYDLETRDWHWWGKRVYERGIGSPIFFNVTTTWYVTAGFPLFVHIELLDNNTELVKYINVSGTPNADADEWNTSLRLRQVSVIDDQTSAQYPATIRMTVECEVDWKLEYEIRAENYFGGTIYGNTSLSHNATAWSEGWFANILATKLDAGNDTLRLTVEVFDQYDSTWHIKTRETNEPNGYVGISINSYFGPNSPPFIPGFPSIAIVIGVIIAIGACLGYRKKRKSKNSIRREDRGFESSQKLIKYVQRLIKCVQKLILKYAVTVKLRE